MILKLIEAYPQFEPLYREVYEMCRDLKCDYWQAESSTKSEGAEITNSERRNGSSKGTGVTSFEKRNRSAKEAISRFECISQGSVAK